jgi:hypothetical protein
VMRDGELQTERDNDSLANVRERTEFAILAKEFGAGEMGGMVNCRQRDNDTLEMVERKNFACNFCEGILC